MRPAAARGCRSPQRPQALKDPRVEIDKVAQDKEAAIAAQEFEKAPVARQGKSACSAKEDEAREGVARKKRDENRPRGQRKTCRRHLQVDRHPDHEARGVRTSRSSSAWRTNCTSGSSARRRRSRHRPSHPAKRAPASRTPSAPIGTFIFLGPTGVGKTDCWPRPWPSSSSATRTPSSASTCPSTWRSSPCQPPHRGAPGLRRLRGGRAAHREGPPQALLRRPLRRDREGPPGRLQHPAPGLRRRRPHRFLGPPGDFRTPSSS
jgi:hypothetical protein